MSDAPLEIGACRRIKTNWTIDMHQDLKKLVDSDAFKAAADQFLKEIENDRTTPIQPPWRSQSPYT